MDTKVDAQILKASLDLMTKHLNAFLIECTDAEGKPKAPSQKALMKMRGYLPPQHSMSLHRKKVIS